jgi:DnaJ-class molecular chaperone
MADDYYEVLEVPRTATPEEIQKAYRKLARKFHPDLHADKSEQEKSRAQRRFKEIQTAYDVLNDPQKREMYDRFGPQFESVQSGGSTPPFRSGGPPFGPGGPFGNVEIDLSELFGAAADPGGQSGKKTSGGFENFFRHFGGGGRGPAQPQAPPRAREVEQEITVSFHLAVMGGDHQVSFQRRGGKVQTITVKIPPGIEDGKRIRLRGQGEIGPTGDRDDLIIKVRVAPHPHYSRSGLNLHVSVPVSLKEAVFGAKIDLPTPQGTIAVTVPKGCENGKVLRLKGQGIQTRERTGDLMVKLLVTLPSHVSSADEQLLRRLSADWNDPNIRNNLNW